MKVLTMRSSSEWKLITASRPPAPAGAAPRSALLELFKLALT
jgi:hypothetical protein